MCNVIATITISIKSSIIKKYKKKQEKIKIKNTVIKITLKKLYF